MSNEPYNGWTNRATWVINLHVNNEEWSAMAKKAMLADHLKTYGKEFCLDGAHVRDFVERIYMLEDVPEGSELFVKEAQPIAGLLADLMPSLLTILNSINWAELARSWEHERLEMIES